MPRSFRTRWVVLVVVVAVVVGMGAIASGPATAQDDAPDCSYPLTLTDASGEEVTVESAPETVVTTSPSAAQTLWEIGARDKVGGVTMHAGYLEGTEERTNVSADPLNVDAEVIGELEPDVVLAPSVTDPADVEELRAIGLTVYRFADASSIDDIRNKTLLQGALVDECAGAQDTVDDMDDRLDAMDDRLQDAGEEPLAYYTLGEGAFEPGSGTFQHEALERAGVRNLVAEAGIEGWDVLSEETIIEDDPTWLIHNEDLPQERLDSAVMETTAWEEDNVVTVDTDHMSQPAPRIVDAIESIHTAVHGDIEEPTPTPTPDTTEAIPGLGVTSAALAVAVLLGAAMVRRRR